MKKLISIAALSASTLALSTAASFADYTLNILHINDWHSRIESNNKFESTCSAEDEQKGECFGGAARLVTIVDQRREALSGQNMLLLNAGDNFQGSLFYSTFKGTVEAEFLNRMKFDAMTVGNHEFDDGEDALVPFLEKIEFPVVSANVAPDAQSKVGDRIKPSVVLEIGGQKIGIVGAVTNDTPEIASPGPHIAITNDVENIAAEVKKLQEQGINKIVALTHVGYVRDMEMIAKIPGVDVVVGGHSHTLLSNTDAKAAGPYPTMIDNPEGYKVPVTQAASYSKYVGELKIVFDDQGVVTSATGDPILLDASVKPDEASLARIKELGAPIEELKAKEVSEASAAIDGGRDTCRAVECTMGNLIADAMLDRTKDQGVTIAIQNGGGIRASIDQGVITMGEVLTVLPFQNTLATFQLTGKDLRTSLEQGLSEIEEGKGKFPQVAGLKYTFDKSVAPNEGRLKSIETMENGAWVPLDDAKLYTIATNNFVRGGGDGYKLFASNAQNAYDFGPGLEQVVADYLAANRPYAPALDGRITDATPAAAPAEEKPAEAAEPEKKAEAAIPELPAMSSTLTATAPTVPVDEAAKKAEEEKMAAEKAAADAAAKKAEEEKMAADKAAADAAAKKAEEEKMAAEKAAADAASKKAEEEKMAAEKAAADAAAKKAEEEKMAAEKAAADAAAKKAEEEKMAAEKAAADKAAAEVKTPELPAMSTTLTTAAPTVPPVTHMIVRGDNLWNISRKFYGRGAMWKKLQEANPDINPNDLTIGASLVIPPAN